MSKIDKYIQYNSQQMLRVEDFNTVCCHFFSQLAQMFVA